jgi:hypothetical protein
VTEDHWQPPPPKPRRSAASRDAAASDADEDEDGKGDVTNPASADVVDASVGASPRARTADGPQVVGLGSIPESWPPLPANAALVAEIGWVQANRLLVVNDRGDSVEVDLSKARSPAPSYATLGWLETSIRAYTKFVDVAARVTATQENEQDMVRRERLAIDEVRRLLSEMLDAGN